MTCDPDNCYLCSARTYSIVDLGQRRSFYALFALGDVRLSEHAVKELSGEDFGYTRIAHVVRKKADPVSEELNIDKLNIDTFLVTLLRSSALSSRAWRWLWWNIAVGSSSR
jgi:hypothetical protein